VNSDNQLNTGERQNIPRPNAQRKPPRDYQDLLVWKKGMVLVRQVYDITRHFPEAEKFGLVSQMRRAAVSIPSNIAEGQARNTTGEFIQFLSHAEGSVAELDTQLILSNDLGFSSPEQVRIARGLILELRKMLSALRIKLSPSK
jgi:four helix bundle protein